MTIHKIIDKLNQIANHLEQNGVIIHGSLEYIDKSNKVSGSFTVTDPKTNDQIYFDITDMLDIPTDNYDHDIPESYDCFKDNFESNVRATLKEVLLDRDNDIDYLSRLVDTHSHTDNHVIKNWVEQL